ncbi:MAG: hypothetical protein WDZ61_00745 [Parcubacteria group bacterium]
MKRIVFMIGQLGPKFGERVLVLPLLAILVLVGGCAGAAHFPRMYLMPQVGIILTVVNNCSPFLDVSSPTHGDLATGLPYGDRVTLPLSSVAFSGSNREIEVYVQGHTSKRVYLGSDTKTFRVNVRSGTRGEVWEVRRLNASNRTGGCMVGHES